MRGGRARGLLTLLFAVSLPILGCGPNERATGAREPERADTLDVSFLDRLLEARVGVLEHGETLVAVLVGAGMDRADALELAGALDTQSPVRSLRAGTPYTLHVSAAGEAMSFEIWPGTREGYRVARGANGWEAIAATRALDRYVRILRGRVETSFYESLLEAGGDAEIVLRVSDVLQWDVDFFLDPRPGDAWTVLIEEWVDGQSVVRHGEILAVEYQGSRVVASAFRHDGVRGVGYYRPDGTSVQRTLLKSPLSYRRISSHFSHRRFHPILRTYRPHLGVDYAADHGTPVVTIGGGTVTFAGTKGGYGRIVIVRHNERLTTQYAHLSRFGRGVRRGVRVDQGQIIGYVGSTGLSTGPHLDFRCTINGRFVNPLRLERPPAAPVPEEELDLFRLQADARRRALAFLAGSGFVPEERFETFVARLSIEGERFRAGAPG